MATSITSNIQQIHSIAQLENVVRDAESKGEQVVHVGGSSVRIVKNNALEKAANKLSGQSTREAAGLDRFATSLRESELRVSGKSLLDRETRTRSLVGKTIDSKVASSFVGQVQRGGTAVAGQSIQFDGTGKIKGFTEGAALSELELYRLESAVVQDLRSANAQGERTAARTESECVLQALGELRQAQARQPDTPVGNVTIVALYESEQSLQKLWLSGQMDKAGAKDALNVVAGELAKLNSDIAGSIAQLATEAGQANAVTQRHDNTFGRMFESSLAKHLVDNPSPKMLETASVINKFMLSHLLTPQKHFTVEDNIKTLAESLKKDARPWHAEVPVIQDFLGNPNADTLRTLLEQPINNGYQMIATYWMAAKLSANVTGPWMNAANDNYTTLIKPSRSSDSTPLSDSGVEHTAQAYAVGTKIFESVTKELDRPGVKESMGVDAWRALRNGVQTHDLALSKSSGTFTQDGQILPVDRDVILSSLNDGHKLLADKFPQAAEKLKALYDQTLTNPELEIGTKSANQSNIDAGAKNSTSNQYGTGLAHQPKPVVPDNWKAEVNIPSKSGLNVNLPTAFEQTVLDRNQNTVNGVSGSTNMLTFLLLHMQKLGALTTPGGEPVDMKEALAGNLAFLVMDGGHSIPEAMATSTSILVNPKYYEPEEFAHVSTAVKADAPKQARAAAQDLIRIERQRVLDHYITDYSALGAQLGGAETASLISQAVTAAFEDTRKSFDALHQARLA
jgi:hypothetical protein